ncbi:Xylose isomerase-like TIM barrel [Rubripirellula amarantea]|uniref:Xylose isomerase-like TIM barrel n=1 Tax=Rubripirellula amarantea TaxID=2527999 RepID=A0A5C5WKH6_9BACT|nr:metabolite traffic protein EboE [Rubripirellula amarantea]TWT50372.1 Xylose isomerase-like TIM barrel [Rubripirellula amarantea]
MSSPKDWIIGYCTNVHAGTDLATIKSNLSTYASGARAASHLDELSVGLWLPSTAATSLVNDPHPFREYLESLKLRPYTINGFPYDNFHQPVVKQSVYVPGWWQQERLDYTKQLARILSALLPDDDKVGTISTLPIGWPDRSLTAEEKADRIGQSGEQLRQLAGFLAKLHHDTGRKIIVAIEPEPGCILQTTDDVIDFFAKELPEEIQRKYIMVCHDICHSAVMMENQAEVLNRLTQAKIGIGKVQVSSAIVGDWSSMSNHRRREAIEQLSHFAEDRYLHQTGRRLADNSFALAEDLPELLSRIASDGDPVWGDERWIVHFHVPIFLERFEHLTTSHADITQCLKALADPKSTIDFTGHLEIETYAWNVMPAAMKKQSLADDIASEVKWLKRAVIDAM